LEPKYWPEVAVRGREVCAFFEGAAESLRIRESGEFDENDGWP
jgi:hypothetical protein